MNDNGINDDPVPIGDSEGTATPAVVSLEPVAFMTHHDEPMLFPTWDEAVQYCDDDESPISLFHADDVAKLQAENEALRKDADRYRWLRDNDWLTEGLLKIFWSHEEFEQLIGDELDAAIDAAMKG